MVSKPFILLKTLSYEKLWIHIKSETAENSKNLLHLGDNQFFVVLYSDQIIMNLILQISENGSKVKP